MALTEHSYQALLLKKALSPEHLGLVQVFLEARVLERYRGAPGFTLVRTNTMGRIQRQGGWSLDFGISPQDGLIHASAGDIATRLPLGELEHWVKHVVTPPYSQNFVKTRLSPGACIDDGEVRSFF